MTPKVGTIVVDSKEIRTKPSEKILAAARKNLDESVQRLAKLKPSASSFERNSLELSRDNAQQTIQRAEVKHGGWLSEVFFLHGVQMLRLISPEGIAYVRSGPNETVDVLVRSSLGETGWRYRAAKGN